MLNLDDPWHAVVILCPTPVDSNTRLGDIFRWLRAEGLSGKDQQTVLERDRPAWPPRPTRMVLGFKDPRTAMAVKMRWG